MTRILSENKSALKDMGGENKELRQTLEKLEQQNTHLGRLYSSVTGQLTQLNKCKGEVEAMKEHAEAMKDAVHLFSCVSCPVTELYNLPRRVFCCSSSSKF